MALSIGGLVGALSWTVLSKFASRRGTVVTAVLTFGGASVVILLLPPLPLILALSASSARCTARSARSTQLRVMQTRASRTCVVGWSG